VFGFSLPYLYSGFRLSLFASRELYKVADPYYDCINPKAIFENYGGFLNTIFCIIFVDTKTLKTHMKKETMLHVGTKIRKIRELKGLTQDYMANSLNLSQNAYSKIEREETGITVERLADMAKILGVEMDTILHFDEKMVFNHSPQSGQLNTNTINNYADDIKTTYEKLLAAKDETIRSQSELIDHLKNIKK
jgi:transcriptional regulator with XRE-family HTH domain